MSRFYALCRVADTHRPLLQLALLAITLGALAIGLGAPECAPDGAQC